MFSSVDHSSYIEKTLKELSPFTPMEKAFRDYYQYTHQMISPSASEIPKIKSAYEHFAYGIIHAKPDNKVSVIPDSKEPFFHSGSFHIMKHPRYIPQKSHTHKFIELFYVLRGNCTHVCDNQHYHLTEGDFCLWQFDAPHYIHSNNDDVLALNILIQKPAFLANFFGVLSEETILSVYFNKILYRNGDSPMLLFRTGNDKQIKNMICFMYQEYQQKNLCWQSVISSCLGFLFAELLRTHSEHLITSAKEEKSDFSLEILRYIQLHCTEITLEDLCQKFNYSSAYLSRLIKKKTGLTFKEIVNGEKIRQAAWLLLNTSRSVSEIAQEVHFCDTSHFSRMFQRVYSLSPSEYRIKHNDN